MTRVFLPHVITDDSALGGSEIERSLRFCSEDSPKLNRTFGTNTSNTTKTLSFWMKRATMGAYQTMFGTTSSGYIESRLQFTNTDELQFTDRDSSSGSTDIQKITNRKFRDVAAWYNIVFVINTTDGTADDRIKIYVNGTQETSFSSSTNPSSSYAVSFFRSSVDNFIGANNTSDFFDGYLAEINFIDGQALDASYFGYTEFQTGLWRPKRYTGTYGTNGFRLEFKDNSGTTATTLGKDTSRNGNVNNWTPNNFSVSAGVGNDSMIDTPTHNYATVNSLHWNVLYGAGGTSNGADFTQANLRFVSPSSVTSPYNRATDSTISVDSGKWYYEATQEHSDNGVTIGFSEVGSIDSNGYYTGSWGFNPFDQRYMIAGTETSYGAKASNGDVLGIAFDLDNNTMQLYINNSGQGVVTGLGISGKTVVMTAKIAFWTNKWVFNFGQQGFTYTPPTGYKALESSNVPPKNVPSIIRPQRFFDTLLYTGTGSSNIVEGLEFSPDMIWVKGRDTNGYEHMIIDTVRGGNNSLVPNSSDAESTHGGRSMTFYPGGVRWNSDSGNCNANGENYVMWCWKAGGSSNTYNIDGIGYGTAAAAGLDGGTTDPTGASVNTENGFGIYTYTGNGTAGANIAHGLGKKPAWILIKSRSASSKNWVVYHHANTDNPSNVYLELSGTDANADETEIFNDTEPTSSLITIGDDGKVNQSSVTYVMYVWTEIPGYSKFGSYTGSGVTNGTYVHLGFRPAWVLFKRSDSSSTNWFIVDIKRDTFNECTRDLFPNNSDNETNNPNFVDFLSNGFKLRTTGTAVNAGTIIYMAFAAVSYTHLTLPTNREV